ncbi:MAG: MATE family efflux transporter [Devosiaceae bacterium]|nr:MATE family efflux transporter [Devosiaceae bacterium MH13]
MTQALAAPQPGAFGWHIKRTLILAGPVILSRVGVLLMTTLDVVVVGRAGAQELAFYVLGYAIFDSLVALMAGLQLGVPTLVSRSVGAGVPQFAGLIWRRGLLFAVVIGGVFALALQSAPWFFSISGQDPLLAEGGGRVTALLGFCLPFMGLYLVSAMLLEALEKPFHATVAVGIANVVNLGLSIVLVFGFGPIPAMGAWGCALATLITSAALGIGLAAYVRYALKGREAYGLADALVDGAAASDPPSAAEQRQLGFASGASYGLEAASFTAITLIAGLLGVIGLAAMGVMFQLFALTFMVSFGIAGATQVRVGNAWGRGNASDMERAGWAGFAMSVLCSVTLSALFLGFPEQAAGLLTNDAQVLAAAMPVMVWMVTALVADGGQTVLNHACRGRGDTWLPTLLHLCSYWLVMVPLAWVLGIALDGGPVGLYQAIMVSSFVSLVSMGVRFRLLSRRGLPPAAPS